MNILKRIILLLTTALLAILTCYGFEKIITATHKIDSSLSYQIKDGYFFAYTSFGIFIIICQIFFNKILNTLQWKIVATVMFFITLEEAFFDIAYSIRSAFGTTWTKMEVRNALVLNHWQTWFLLFVTTLLFVAILSILNKWAHNTKHNV
jgi:hypothetical protein